MMYLGYNHSCHYLQYHITQRHAFVLVNTNYTSKSYQHNLIICNILALKNFK